MQQIDQSHHASAAAVGCKEDSPRWDLVRQSPHPPAVATHLDLIGGIEHEAREALGYVKTDCNKVRGEGLNVKSEQS